jgi:ligand-binding sensor domain-containing protein
MRHFLLTVIGLAMLLPVTAQTSSYGLTPVQITGTTNSILYKQTLVADTSTNAIWIGYRNAGAARYQNNAWTIYDTANSGIPGNWVNAIAPNGITTWFGTSTGLGRLINNNWVSFNTSNSGLVSDNVLSLNAAGSALWVGTYKGLHYFDGNSNWTVYDSLNSPLPSNFIFCMDRDANGQLYIGTNRGFCVFNPATQNWTIYDVQNSVLDNNLIKAVYCRGPGDVWLSTNNQVYHLSGSVLSAFSDLYITTVVGDPRGVSSFSSDGNGNLVFY